MPGTVLLHRAVLLAKSPHPFVPATALESQTNTSFSSPAISIALYHDLHSSRPPTCVALSPDPYLAAPRKSRCNLPCTHDSSVMHSRFSSVLHGFLPCQRLQLQVYAHLRLVAPANSSPRITLTLHLHAVMPSVLSHQPGFAHANAANRV